MSDTAPDGPTYPVYPVVITTALLEEHGACSEGLAAFLAAYPTGELVIADAAAHAAALSGPLAEWEGWAVTDGILPRLVMTAGYGGIATAGYGGTATAGHRGTAIVRYGGTATAGYRGTAIAGYRGTATAGDWGIATAGDWGTATAGYRGIASAGDWGTAVASHDGAATAGDYGTAIVGRRGTATAGHGGVVTAGDGGTLILRWRDDRTDRYRVASAYVGEHAPGLPDDAVIEAGVMYRVDVVEGRPMWRRAKVTP